MNDQLHFTRLLFAISEQVGWEIDPGIVAVYQRHLEKYGLREVNTVLTEMWCYLTVGDPFPSVDTIIGKFERVA